MHGLPRLHRPVVVHHELRLVRWDWAETFTAVQLVLRPMLEDVWLWQLAELAERHGDEQLWLLLSNLQLDAQRSRRWSAALARFAIDQRSENAAVLGRWIATWAPRADHAAAGLAQFLANLPDKPRAAEQTCESARRARDGFLASAGLAGTGA